MVFEHLGDWFRKEDKENVSVPTSKKELKPGTYGGIAKKAGWE
jgi:predicted RNA binding protein YcfA (HicA-like mRNA interferase family)